jgi:hypothetical protein
MKVVDASCSMPTTDFIERTAIMRGALSEAPYEHKVLWFKNESSQCFDAKHFVFPFVTVNKLYKVTWEEGVNDKKVPSRIINWQPLSLAEVAERNGYSFEESKYDEDYPFYWATPARNIQSPLLVDFFAETQMLFARLDKYADYEDFTIARPSLSCDYVGVLQAIHATNFTHVYSKDIALAGALLFCVHRAFNAIKDVGHTPSKLDHDVIVLLDKAVKKLAVKSTWVADHLREFIMISELNATDCMASYSEEAVFVKDCYDVLQPALDERREIARRRFDAGYDDYS